MRAVRLDFQSRPGAGSLVGWGLLLVGALVAGGAFIDHQALRDEIERWEAKAARWESALQRLTRAAPGAGEADAKTLAREAQRTAVAISRLAAPWGELYRALEESAGDSVALLALQSDLAGGKVLISGEAKNFPALTAYMERLGQSGALADVQLVSHDIRRGDPQNPLVFTLSAVWKLPR